MSKHSEKISEEYSKAINESKNIVSATGSAKFAGYTMYELDNLPKGVTDNSFGCGNPLADSFVKTGDIVLDMGCGSGLDLLLAAEKVGVTGKVIGIDMNEDMLIKAQDNIDRSGYENIEVRKGMIENLPINSNSVDWVISNCVVNLSSCKKDVFTEVARVLKPNGQLLVSDIVSENLPWWVKRSGLLTAACVGGTLPERDYIQGLKNAGITNCSVISRQYYEPPQLVSAILDILPPFLTKISCCGKGLAERALLKLAAPIAKNLWSAQFSGKFGS